MRNHAGRRQSGRAQTIIRVPWWWSLWPSGHAHLCRPYEQSQRPGAVRIRRMNGRYADIQSVGTGRMVSIAGAVNRRWRTSES